MICIWILFEECYGTLQETHAARQLHDRTWAGVAQSAPPGATIELNESLTVQDAFDLEN